LDKNRKPYIYPLKAHKPSGERSSLKVGLTRGVGRDKLKHCLTAEKSRKVFDRRIRDTHLRVLKISLKRLEIEVFRRFSKALRKSRR